MKYENIFKEKGFHQSWVTTVDGDEYKQLLEVYSAEVQKSRAIPGFRKGKAPLNIVASAYGSSFYADAMQKLLPAIYNQAIADNGFNPVGDPSFNVAKVDAEAFCFVTNVNVYPDIRIERYKGLEAIRPDDSVSESELDNAVEKFRDLHRDVQIADQQRNDDDIVYYSLNVQLDGKTVQDLLQVSVLQRFDFKDNFPGLKEHLAGCKPGDIITYEISVPEDDPRASVAGKTVTVNVRVEEVKERRLREISDELFSSFNTGCSSVAEYREKTRAEIHKYRAQDADAAFRLNLRKALAEQVTANIPNEMLDRETGILLHRMAANLNTGGSSLTEFLKNSDISADALKDKAKELAVEELKYIFAIDAIAAAEGITDEDENVRERKAFKIVTDNAVVLPESEA